MKIVVLMGGASDEREVSLASGAQVAGALRERGHDVLAADTFAGLLSLEDEVELRLGGVGARPPANSRLARMSDARVARLASEPPLADADLFFLALHGGAGENGAIQGLLDMVRAPYTGSDRLGCTLAMDKDVTKRLLRDAGIATPDWFTATEAGEIVDPAGSASDVAPEDLAATVERRLGLPVVVKAATGGSSLRLELARDRAALDRAVRASRSWRDLTLFERYHRGREFTVGVVGDEALPVGEIVPRGEYFDYQSKYQPGMAEEIFPARIDPTSTRQLQYLARRVFRVLRMRDYGRVDFIVGPDGAPWCLEANGAPGMTANSLLPKAAAAAGMTFPKLCDRIARLALARYGDP